MASLAVKTATDLGGSWAAKFALFLMKRQLGMLVIMMVVVLFGRTKLEIFDDLTLLLKKRLILSPNTNLNL